MSSFGFVVGWRQVFGFQVFFAHKATPLVLDVVHVRLFFVAFPFWFVLSVV